MTHGIDWCCDETNETICDYVATLQCGVVNKISLNGQTYGFAQPADICLDTGRALMERQILGAIRDAGYSSQDGIRLDYNEATQELTVQAFNSALVFNWIGSSGNQFLQTCVSKGVGTLVSPLVTCGGNPDNPELVFQAGTAETEYTWIIDIIGPNGLSITGYPITGNQDDPFPVVNLAGLGGDDGLYTGQLTVTIDPDGIPAGEQTATSTFVCTLGGGSCQGVTYNTPSDYLLGGAWFPVTDTLPGGGIQLEFTDPAGDGFSVQYEDPNTLNWVTVADFTPSTVNIFPTLNQFVRLRVRTADELLCTSPVEVVNLPSICTISPANDPLTYFGPTNYIYTNNIAELDVLNTGGNTIEYSLDGFTGWTELTKGSVNSVDLGAQYNSIFVRSSDGNGCERIETLPLTDGCPVVLASVPDISTVVTNAEYFTNGLVNFDVGAYDDATWQLFTAQPGGGFASYASGAGTISLNFSPGYTGPVAAYFEHIVGGCRNDVGIVLADGCAGVTFPDIATVINSLTGVDDGLGNCDVTVNVTIPVDFDLSVMVNGSPVALADGDNFFTVNGPLADPLNLDFYFTDEIGGCETAMIPQEVTKVAAAMEILMLVADELSIGLSDQNMADVFINAGHNVTFRSFATAVNADATGKDFILVTDQGNSLPIASLFFDQAVPILNCERAFIDDWKFATAGDRSLEAQTEFEVVNTTHPIMTGQILGDLVVASPGVRHNYGEVATLGPDATVLAQIVSTSISQAGEPCLWVYDTGEEMTTSFNAPARRVMAWVQTDGNMNAAAEAIFLKCGEWLAGNI